MKKEWFDEFANEFEKIFIALKKEEIPKNRFQESLYQQNKLQLFNYQDLMTLFS